MAKFISSETHVKEEYEITRDDIICLLRHKDVDVPDDAEIFMPVPGGGDWSHMNLHLGQDTPLKVRFTISA